MKETKVYKVASDAQGTLKNTVLSQDAFARNGYTLKDSEILGIEGDKCFFLYINAEPEFFEQNKIKLEGVEEITDEQADAVKTKVENMRKEIKKDMQRMEDKILDAIKGERSKYKGIERTISSHLINHTNNSGDYYEGDNGE